MLTCSLKSSLKTFNCCFGGTSWNAETIAAFPSLSAQCFIPSKTSAPTAQVSLPSPGPPKSSRSLEKKAQQIALNNRSCEDYEGPPFLFICSSFFSNQPMAKRCQKYEGPSSNFFKEVLFLGGCTGVTVAVLGLPGTLKSSTEVPKSGPKSLRKLPTPGMPNWGNRTWPSCQLQVQPLILTLNHVQSIISPVQN